MKEGRTRRKEGHEGREDIKEGSTSRKKGHQGRKDIKEGRTQGKEKCQGRTDINRYQGRIDINRYQGRTNIKEGRMSRKDILYNRGHPLSTTPREEGRKDGRK